MPAGRNKSVLPGFGLTMGVTVLYLSLMVVLPLSAVFMRVSSLSLQSFWEVITAPRVLAAYRLTFGAALLAALINVLFGVIVAWVLVRYEFPLKRLIDGLVDLPFALPTAVAGIALTALYSPSGWLGSLLLPFNIKVAFAPLGVLVALTFIGVPFVVRTVQPVLEDLDPEIEEAAVSMGASAFQTFVKVVLPILWPSILTGFSLAFARALGEYGSVVFISGNMPMRTEIVPLLIMAKLEQFDYRGASALAVVMLAASFSLMLIINAIQFWANRRAGNLRS